MVNLSLRGETCFQLPAHTHAHTRVRRLICRWKLIGISSIVDAIFRRRKWSRGYICAFHPKATCLESPDIITEKAYRER